MPATIMRDDSIALLQEKEHLGIPVVAGKRPAVMEHDRLTGTPVLVVNLGAVLRGDRTHVGVSAWMWHGSMARCHRAESVGDARQPRIVRARRCRVDRRASIIS